MVIAGAQNMITVVNKDGSVFARTQVAWNWTEKEPIPGSQRDRELGTDDAARPWRHGMTPRP